MYRLDETVVSDESQASQLLRDVLRDPPAGKQKQSSRRGANKIELLDIKATPLNLQPLDVRYTYAGLSDTQFQSLLPPVSPASEQGLPSSSRPVGDNELPDFSSVTERRDGVSGWQRAGDNLFQNGNGELVEDQPLSSTSARFAGTRQRGKNFPSDPRIADTSRLTDAPAKSSTRPLQPRSRQREDSFAGVLPIMDRANAFMRDSAVFCKPLSKLGVDSQTDGDLEDNLSMSSSPNVSHSLGLGSHHPSSYFVPDSDNSQSIHSQKYPIFGGQRHSQSEYTQSPESHQGRGQESCSEDFPPPAFRTQSPETVYEPTEPSNSFYYEPTQIEHEPTQPRGSEDTDICPGRTVSFHPHTHVMSGPPGILSMVDPAKPWRRRGAVHVLNAGGVDPHINNGAVSGTTQDECTSEDTRDDEPESPSQPTQPAYPPMSRFHRNVRPKLSPPTGSVVSDSEAPPLNTYHDVNLSSFDNGDWRASEPCDDAPADLSVSVAEPMLGQVNGWQSSEPCDMEPAEPQTSCNPDIPMKNTSVEDEDDAAGQPGETAIPLVSLREEDESEDELPLASAPKRRKVSRWASAAQMPPPKVIGVGNRPVLAERAHESTDSVVVPSSDPQQDFPKGRTVRLEVKSDRNNQTAAAIPRAVTSTSPRPETPSKSSSSSPLSSDHETTDNGDLASALDIDKCEAVTEPADDDYMNIEPIGTSTPTFRKRKRGVPSKTTTFKESGKLSRAMSTTPLTARRLKVSSSTSRSAVAEATRVFALWKQDAHYYSGVVFCQPDRLVPQYIINFDDDTQDTVDLGNLRQCTLVKGDSVMLNQIQRKARVLHAIGDQVTVQISGDTDALELHLRDVRVAAGTVRNDWNHRKLNVGQVIPVVRPRSIAETPSKNSLASSGSLLGGHKFKMLSGIGLVVTLSPGTEEWESQKNQVMNAIKTKGGIVMEDWNEVFNLDGKVERSGKRWVARKKDVTVRRSLENVFLISDAPHQKPKYLIALALGIPCVSSDWLVNEHELKTWPGYLLAAGFSTQLHYRMSQLVNLDWGDEDRHLERVMHNLAPVKVFANKSILYISPDFVPQPKGRKIKTDAAQAQEANRSIPKILLCMGAERVEAIATEGDASQAPRAFDYVVVKEPAEVHQFSVKGATCVHFKWVKDCLLSGRILPLDFSYST